MHLALTTLGPDEAKSRPQRGGYLRLRRYASTSEILPSANTELEMLPAYSPFLNIVEQAISLLKAAIKGDVSRPEIQARMDDRAEARRLGIPLGEMRTRLLLDALQRCIGVITAAKAYQWFRFMQTYLPRCLNGEEIE